VKKTPPRTEWIEFVESCCHRTSVPDKSHSVALVPRPTAAGPHSTAWSSSLSRLLTGWSLAVAALGACWISLFVELHREWNVNPQYGYGWVIPVIGPMLIWRRFRKRPAPSPSKSVLLGLIAASLLFLLLPLDLFLEANPEWRLLYWFHGCLVLILSFCLLYRAGGWSWVKYFAPPLVFMLIAIPWPMQLEQLVVQSLMRFVAGLTVAVVGFFGIPAVQHGNLIEVKTGVVGIDEACSGVRSLQSALMLSLFLGELYLFRPGRRVALLVASMMTVLFANVVRTSYLTRTAAVYGVEQMKAVHDFAGMLVMVIVLPVLFGLAFWMGRKQPESSNEPANHAVVTQTIPRWVAAGVLVWMGIAWALTQTWYRIHERDLVATTPWAVSWPTQSGHFQKTAVPAESLAILRCSDSDAATWEDDQGNQWSAFVLKWNGGKNSVELAKGHRPDICYPAAGENLVKDYGRTAVSANGIDLSFTVQSFQNGAGLMYVFYCLWSDRVSRHETPIDDSSWKSRLQAVLTGQRNLGQQVLEVDVIGPQSNSTALSLFRSEMGRIVHPE
jgi:exosortase